MSTISRGESPEKSYFCSAKPTCRRSTVLHEIRPSKCALVLWQCPLRIANSSFT